MARKKKKSNIPNVVPNVAPSVVPNIAPEVVPNAGLASVQNMPPQYIPPTPGQGLQTSPMTKAQKKIANAKFPAARAWWEGVKGGIGGTPESVEQFSRLTPEQQSILSYLQQLGVHGLQNPYGGFAPIAQQAQNEFYQQTVPSLAHRFTSLGNASLSSPDFAAQLGGAGAGLQQNLAAQQAEYGQQNIGQILQMLQLGLNPYTENVFRPAQTGLARSGINALLKGLTAGMV